ARDPVALGQHADDLRVRMLRNLADQRLSVRLRHPVFGLDLLVTLDALLEAALERGVAATSRLGIGRGGIEGLGVHGSVLPLRNVTQEYRITIYFCVTLFRARIRPCHSLQIPPRSPRSRPCCAASRASGRCAAARFSSRSSAMPLRRAAVR